jgi:DNA-binding winged helix-turn-helix (wHTH) protein
LLKTRPGADTQAGGGALVLGELIIDEATYTARLRGRALELTYKEFELLKYLAQHAGRVFTRAQLLQEVWGYDFFGGTRTVDVHVRRLRAKLGPEHEQLIGTVRNVGYKFVRPGRAGLGERRDAAEAADTGLLGTETTNGVATDADVEADLATGLGTGLANGLGTPGRSTERDAGAGWRG